MPITQQRMFALITAAQAYQAHTEQVVNAALASIPQGTPARLAFMEQVARTQPSPECIATIARETEHFRLTAARNDLNRRRQRRRRGAPEQDLPPLTRQDKSQSVEDQAALMGMDFNPEEVGTLLDIEKALSNTPKPPTQAAAPETLKDGFLDEPEPGKG